MSNLIRHRGHSALALALAAVGTGMAVRIACPPGYGPTDVDLERLRAFVPGADVRVSSYADEAVKGADVVSTDAWYAIGQEAEADECRRAFEGFTVDSASLPAPVQETHVSLFDGTNAGIALADKPVFSVQHHPEASPGPTDSLYLFERFAGLMDRAR